MENEIITQILYLLDGWKLKEDIEEAQANEEEPEITDMDFNKLISSDEVLHFYNVAYNYALSYTKLKEFPTYTIIKIVDEVESEITEIEPQIQNALYMWSAGLLWRKYNIRSNDQIDDTNTFGYGDQLVIQAKEILKTVKGYSFYAY